MSASGSNPVDEEQLRYKDEYKKILADLIGTRKSSGCLEAEEAIEGSTPKSFSGASLEDTSGEASSSTKTCTSPSEKEGKNCELGTEEFDLINSLNLTLGSPMIKYDVAIRLKKTFPRPIVEDSVATSELQLVGNDFSSESVQDKCNSVSLVSPEPSLLAVVPDMEGSIRSYHR